MMPREGDVLFEDPFDGSGFDRWPIPPISLMDDPVHGPALHLRAGDPNAGLWLGWAGDESWRDYRVEMEVLPVDGGGFLGFDFHVQDDESGCCNVHFQAFPEGGELLFEGCGRYDDSNTSWKLGPLSQRRAPFARGEWIRLRLDAGETVANLYVYGCDKPVFTIYDLPFSRGGIRLWRYHASAFFRNLRVTALDRVEPILDDTWGSVISPGVIRNWSVSRMLPRGSGPDGVPSPEALSSIALPQSTLRADALSAAFGDMGWRAVGTDRRGVVNVVGIDPGEYCQPGVVFAKATLESPGDATRSLRLTYTDQLSMWVNGHSVFTGERRGWSDPGRSEADGWGRLMPDQFEVEAPLKSGKNEILVRLEVNEPLFGSGFWVRAL